MHLAHLNVARVRAPLDDPLMREFTSNIDRVNRLAETAPGFIWRLPADGDSTYGMAAGSDDVILTLSVWESLDALRAFVYETEHARFLRRRREWFLPYDGPHVVLWWSEPGKTPSVEEAFGKLARLREHGPSPDAFTFASMRAPRHPHSPLAGTP